MSEPRKAATVLLLRDGEAGVEVFMVQRNRRSGFLPNAWVFPGGRVDEADLATGPEGVRGSLRLPGLSDDEARAVGVAAVRETLEEAGIFLGDAERRVPHLDRLLAWSWWVTPAAEPKRFDTRFLVARSTGEVGRHDGGETVDSRWVAPRAVLDRPVTAFPLAPPTWWTLRELAAYDDVAAALADAPNRPTDKAIQPVMEFTDGGFELLLPGHARHTDPPVAGLPDHIGWDGQHWIASRGGRRLDR